MDLDLSSYQPHPLPAPAPSTSATLGQPAEETALPTPVAHPPSAKRPVQAPQPLLQQQVQTQSSNQQTVFESAAVSPGLRRSSQHPSEVAGSRANGCCKTDLKGGGERRRTLNNQFTTGTGGAARTSNTTKYE